MGCSMAGMARFPLCVPFEQHMKVMWPEVTRFLPVGSTQALFRLVCLVRNGPLTRSVSCIRVRLCANRVGAPNCCHSAGGVLS